MPLAIRPLRRNFSISVGDLQMIMPFQESANLIGDGFGFRVAIDIVEAVPLAIIVNQRFGLTLVGHLALPNSLLLVIGAVNQWTAIQVTDSLPLRGPEVNVVDRAANRASASAGGPLDDHFRVDPKIHYQRRPAPFSLEDAVEKLCLAQRARKAVENEPPPAVRLLDPLFYHTTNDLVRDHPTFVAHAPRRQSLGAVSVHSLAKHLAGRD